MNFYNMYIKPFTTVTSIPQISESSDKRSGEVVMASSVLSPKSMNQLNGRIQKQVTQPY